MPRLEFIAEGSYGKVYRYGDGKVLKEMDNLDLDNFATVLIELSTLRRFRHPHMVAFVSFDISIERTQILMEGCDRNLSQELKAFGLPGTQVATEWMNGVIAATGFLHRNNFYHLDIKPQNILIKRVPRGRIAKLCDFGCGQYRTFDMVTNHGTVITRPPENFMFMFSQDQIDELGPYVNIDQEFYGPETDVFSLGVTWVYALTQKYLFYPYKKEKDTDTRALERIVTFCKDPKAYLLRTLTEVRVSEDILDVILKMLHPDRHQRLTLQNWPGAESGYSYGVFYPIRDPKDFKDFIEKHLQEIISHRDINQSMTFLMTLDLLVRSFALTGKISVDDITVCGAIAACFFEEDYDVHEKDLPGIVRMIRLFDGIIYNDNLMISIRNMKDFETAWEKYLQVAPYLGGRVYLEAGGADFPEDIDTFASVAYQSRYGNIQTDPISPTTNRTRPIPKDTQAAAGGPAL
jgi:serine/threonine protein kinase